MRVRRPLACLTVLLLLAAIAGVPLRQRIERNRSAEATARAAVAAAGAAPVVDGGAAYDDADGESPAPQGRRQTRCNLISPRRPTAEPARSPLTDALGWLARHAQSEGSWGMVAEVVEGEIWTPEAATALSLLAFIGAGYTERTRQRWDEVDLGPLIARGLSWLADRPPGDARTAALTSLALSESVGLSGSDVFRPAAQRALEDLLSRQAGDGSWGDPDSAPWGAMALASARISGLEVPDAAVERAKSWFAARLGQGGTPADVVGWLLLTHDRRNPSAVRILRASTNALPTPENLSFASAYFGSLAAFQFDGPGGPVDRRWVHAIRSSFAAGVLPQDGEGRTSDVVLNALGALSLERYDAYTSHGRPPGEPLEPLPPDPEPEPEGLRMGEEAPESYDAEFDPDRLRMGDEMEPIPEGPGSPEPSEESPEPR